MPARRWYRVAGGRFGAILLAATSGFAYAQFDNTPAPAQPDNPIDQATANPVRDHAELHSQEKQAELQDADRDAITDDIAPGHRRTAYEDHEWQRGQREAHGGERERWNFAQRDLDRYERVAPDRDDGERQEQVARSELGLHEGLTRKLPAYDDTRPPDRWRERT